MYHYQIKWFVKSLGWDQQGFYLKEVFQGLQLASICTTFNFSVFEWFLPLYLGQKKEERKKKVTDDDVDIVQWRQQITVPFSILSIVLRFSTCVQCNERQGGTVERMLFIDACPGCASTPAPSSPTASLDSSWWSATSSPHGGEWLWWRRAHLWTLHGLLCHCCCSVRGWLCHLSQQAEGGWWRHCQTGKYLLTIIIIVGLRLRAPFPEWAPGANILLLIHGDLALSLILMFCPSGWLWYAHILKISSKVKSALVDDFGMYIFWK